MQDLKEKILSVLEQQDDKVAFVNDLREFIHREVSTINQPIDFVRWIPIDKVQPNDYNPNSVAKIEMGLLYKSIKHDGYTQPVVAIYDPDIDKYVIVDGFHRYFVCKTQADISERNHGYLPVVVIEKTINERMAATIRHNRARGEHSVSGMSSMVFKLLENGWADEEICNHLGMDAEEILKIKHLTGFAKLFKDTNYKQAWETNRMIKLRHEQEAKEKQREA